jgi:hypothetical protein
MKSATGSETAVVCETIGCRDTLVQALTYDCSAIQQTSEIINKAVRAGNEITKIIYDSETNLLKRSRVSGSRHMKNVEIWDMDVRIPKHLQQRGFVFDNILGQSHRSLIAL